MQVCLRIKWESAGFWYSTASIYRGLKAVLACGSTASSIDGYLLKFMKLSFSELIFVQSMSMCLEFLFSQP